MNDTPNMPPRRGRPPLNRPAHPFAELQQVQETVAERPAMREEDPRARAARRAAELRDNREDNFESTDEFAIDPASIPDGWDYEWKRKYVLNQEDNSHMLAVRRAGWEEVPTTRHPEMMPLGSQEPFIMRKGMILMERPKEISEEARRRDQRNAKAQVRGKEEQLNSVAPGQFERNNATIKKSFEAVPIPD